MHCKARFVCAAWLVVAAACSDDGLTVQDLNSSSTAGTSGVGEATGSGPGPTGGGDGSILTGTGDGGEATTNADSDPGSATSGGTHHEDSTGETPPGETSTTGESSATSGETSTTSEGTDGSGSSDTGTGTTGCDMITGDASGIGAACLSALDCPEEYTCQPFAGIVLQQTCQILCTQDCECPVGLSCIETSDKIATWYQCG